MIHDVLYQLIWIWSPSSELWFTVGTTASADYVCFQDWSDGWGKCSPAV